MPIGTHPHEGADAVTEVPADAATDVSPPSSEARLRVRDAGGGTWRAVRRAQKDHATNLAQALAFNLFRALPATALILVRGLPTVSSEGTAGRLLQHLSGVVPDSVATPLHPSLTRMGHTASVG